MFNRYEELSDSIAVAAKTPSEEFMKQLNALKAAGDIDQKEFRKRKRAERERLAQLNSERQKRFTNEALEKFVLNIPIS